MHRPISNSKSVLVGGDDLGDADADVAAFATSLGVELAAKVGTKRRRQRLLMGEGVEKSGSK